ncbi:MAG: histidinol-phosphate aminotransferase family protein [Candidatus Methanoplasma sp.]|jgi:threonine-phosphate decarboxylase|nr:histidinol-phosphate aminotransferase family protein [Candidatus Methanoplasma sp.]
MSYAKKALAALPKTVHGGQAWKIEGIEDYSHNLNPFGPPECLPEIVAEALGEVGHYPDDSCHVLKETISKEFGVGTENVTVGAGSSEIIRNFPNAFIESGDKVLLNSPSFAEYTQQCRIVGADIRFNKLQEKDDFRIDREKITEAISSGIKAFYICNPNNPTGRIEPKKKILEIVKECRDSNVLVFLDETLLELVPEHKEISCASEVKRYNNLVVAGSLTKSFAIPGIRVGFGFADPSLIEAMDKIRMTWNMGQIEQTVADILIRDHMGYVENAARIMAEESKVMHSQLLDIGFPVGDIADSFFYFNSLKSLGIKSAEFQKLMLKGRIMVRDCASFGEPFEWFVRFSVKDRQRNDAFVSAAENALKELR